jgi:hypothetical protein
MALLMSVVTALLVLFLALAVRHWLVTIGELPPWSDDEEEFDVSRDSPESIAAEITVIEDRLRELNRTGGSRTWTATFAIAWLRRRRENLREHRQRCLERARRWPHPVKDPAGIRLPHPQDRSRRNIQTHERPAGEWFVRW